MVLHSFMTDFIVFPEYAQLFAALIARTAKDIDVLIDSLPSEESTATLQVRVGLKLLMCFVFPFISLSEAVFYQNGE